MSNTKLRAQCWVALSLLVCAAAWAQTEAPKSEPAKGSPGVAAYIADEAILLKDLDEQIMSTNMDLARSLYEARREALDQMILERSLGPEAKERNVPIADLIKEKVAAKMGPVTDEQIQAFYDSNRNRIGTQTLEQVSPQIKKYLEAQRDTEARAALVKEVREKANVRVTLDAPRVKMAVAANDPAIGPADAKVTIVEYSDFQ